MDINTLLIVLVVLILVALVAHGIWSNRREKVQMFKSSKTFTQDARKPQDNQETQFQAENNNSQESVESKITEDDPQPLTDEQALEKIKISIPNARTPLADNEPVTSENSNLNLSIDELTNSPEFDEEEGLNISSQQIQQELVRQRHEQESFSQEPTTELYPNGEISRQPSELTESKESKIEVDQSSHEQLPNEEISSQPLYPMNTKEWKEQSEPQSAPQSNTTVSNDKNINSSPKKNNQLDFIILYIVARNRRSFMGTNITQLMDSLGFIYGEHNIYHRHLDLNDASPILFSVANMLKPGTFPIENMHDFKTEGLTLFMNIPSPGKDDVNFKFMLKAAETISQNLDGFLLNDKREEFTNEMKEEYLARLK